MGREAEREARKALARLRRSVEKAARELADVERVLEPEEGGDFPSAAFAETASRLDGIRDFIDEQAERLQAKLLEAGGLPAGAGRRAPGAKDRRDDDIGGMPTSLGSGPR